jgi:putative transposase
VSWNARTYFEGGVGFFRAGDEPATAGLVKFVDEHRGRFPVAALCEVLGLPSSTYYAAKHREANPSPRAVRDEELRLEIRRVWKGKGRRLYGAKKV